jgi:hypothetical protein
MCLEVGLHGKNCRVFLDNVIMCLEVLDNVFWTM